MNRSTIYRALRVYEQAMLHYEEGNQSKSLQAVWRNRIAKEHGISDRTFRRYIKIARELKRIEAKQHEKNNSAKTEN